ncbi:hypothetical protein HPB48_010025 [Haemaphysalis longicornis]|uniref:Uncharacterized protein n=1 Tax=Haemaphysalis longicornis TaxID=44386 RepID=A0A9J6GCE1_HAELO|nr:hypothetical protein HPB48_010025 [Haemaphysalis longicornis]
MNAFTGHMKATMMVRPEPERIDSMKQLAQRQGIKTFVWQGSAYESLLKVRWATTFRRLINVYALFSGLRQ